MSVAVILGNGVVRIDHAYTVYEELIGVLAGCQINPTDPPVAFFRTVVLRLDPVVENAYIDDGWL